MVLQPLVKYTKCGKSGNSLKIEGKLGIVTLSKLYRMWKESGKFLKLENKYTPERDKQNSKCGRKQQNGGNIFIDISPTPPTML